MPSYFILIELNWAKNVQKFIELFDVGMECNFFGSHPRTGRDI